MAPKVRNFILGILPFIFILIIWQVASVEGWISEFVFPSPDKIFPILGNLIREGTLLRLFLISLLNIFPAFLIAIIFSLVLGTIIGVSNLARKIFSPILSAFYLVPSLAWLPLIILILGFTRQSIWAVVFISSFTRIIYSVIGGVQSVNNNYILVAKNLGFSRLDIIIKVIIPAALPQILSGFRVGFGSSWRSLVGAEMLVVTAGGLGKYIWLSQWVFKFDQVIAGIFMIAVIGIIAEFLVFRKIENITIAKWGMQLSE